MTEDRGASRHELFRYRRGDELRIYSLHVVEGGTEFWRVTMRAGQPDRAIKEEDFTSADVAARYFEEMRRALTAGGWRDGS